MPVSIEADRAIPSAGEDLAGETEPEYTGRPRLQGAERMFPDVVDMPGRDTRSAGSSYTARPAVRDGVAGSDHTGAGRRERPSITRQAAPSRVGGTPNVRHTGLYDSHHAYSMDIHLARYHWLHSVHRRQVAWYPQRRYPGHYLSEPYWGPFRPHIGRWPGYDSWYSCTPYTTGVWLPWHRRVLVGYAYYPSRYDVPFSTTVWVNYDPFIYSFWPAPYSVSVNYYTTEPGEYPIKSGEQGTYLDWVQHEPSTTPEYVVPEYGEEYVPPETWVEEPGVELADAEPWPTEPKHAPTPAGVVEAATLPEETSVEIGQVVPAQPLDNPTLASVSAVQQETGPGSQPLGLPVPGRGTVRQTAMVTGGLAFLGAALWMAWPRA
jgi:hypothetical protein